MESITDILLSPKTVFQFFFVIFEAVYSAALSIRLTRLKPRGPPRARNHQKQESMQPFRGMGLWRGPAMGYYGTGCVCFCLQAYVSCSLGIWNIGYIMIVYGVVDAICSFGFGRLVQYVGHIPFFVLGELHIRLMVCLFVCL